MDVPGVQSDNKLPSDVKYLCTNVSTLYVRLAGLVKTLSQAHGTSPHKKGENGS